MSRWFIASLVALAASSALAEEIPPEQLKFFEAQIRPALQKHCYECHATTGSGKRVAKGGLLLDTREGIRRGGNSGPAVVPGELEKSWLWGSITYVDLEMPPKNKLPDAVIADFKKWIEMGAPDPRDGTASR